MGQGFAREYPFIRENEYVSIGFFLKIDSMELVLCMMCMVPSSGLEPLVRT
jgi:hypothetical protein